MSTVVAFASASTAAALCCALSAARESSSWLLSDTAQMPSPIATAAAMAATDASTGETRRREPIGTTFCCSAPRGFEDPLAERGARRRAVGSDGQAAVTSQNDASSSWHCCAVLEVRLVGLPLGGLERVERVAGCQLVDVRFP